VLSVGATLERIEAHVREFVAYAPFADDVTMLAIRRISPHG
jgi:serine phosphatase RsbU (regulator of sigma subunit)